MKITITGIGADPELFLVGANEEIVSAIGKIGGTKKEPLSLGVPGYFVQEDNVLAEFNIPPAKDADEFVANITLGLELLNLHLDGKYKVLAKAFHVMDESQLQDEKAKAFGCDPDIIAWDNRVNIPEPPSDGLRTSSGHFHFGYENPDYEVSLKLAKAFDIFHAVPSVLIDEDNRRRELYGAAGSFRQKSYGLEYRSLSSFWVGDPTLTRWVFENATKAAEFVEKGGLDSVDFMKQYDILTAVNFYDKPLAKALVEYFNVPMP